MSGEGPFTPVCRQQEGVVSTRVRQALEVAERECAFPGYAERRTPHRAVASFRSNAPSSARVRASGPRWYIEVAPVRHDAIARNTPGGNIPRALKVSVRRMLREVGSVKRYPHEFGVGPSHARHPEVERSVPEERRECCRRVLKFVFQACFVACCPRQRCRHSSHPPTHVQPVHAVNVRATTTRRSPSLG